MKANVKCSFKGDVLNMLYLSISFEQNLFGSPYTKICHQPHKEFFSPKAETEDEDCHA